MKNEIAIRYAEGMFALAKENGSVRSYKEQAESCLEVLAQSPELNAFFASVKITNEEKKQFVEEVFAKEFDRPIVNLIKLMVDKGRISFLKDTLEEFVDLCNEELGIQHAYVYSARALEGSDFERIRERLSAESGKEIYLENKIDPTLLAGIKVVMGNRVTDSTMKSRIDELKRTLLKGGQA